MNPPRGILRIRISVKASGTYISGALLIPTYARSSTGRAAVSKTAGRWFEANRAIPSRVYDILKWLGLIVLPALALFVSTVGPAWGWTHVDAIVTTLNALGILAGALIGVSAIKQRLDLAA